MYKRMLTSPISRYSIIHRIYKLYPQRMRLPRRLHGIYIVCFLYLSFPATQLHVYKSLRLSIPKDGSIVADNVLGMYLNSLHLDMTSLVAVLVLNSNNQH